MADPEAREIEQTGSKVVDNLLSAARESGMIVKITEKATEHGHTWAAEFRIPVEAPPGNLLHQIQEYDHLSVYWTRVSIKGRRPRMLTASRWGLTSHRKLKTVKDMHRELSSMRRDAERVTARLALREGGESWRLETRGHQRQPLSARTVTLEHAERLVSRADEITAVLAEEVRFWLYDRDRYGLVRCALVRDVTPSREPQGAAEEPHGFTWDHVRRVEARELKVGDVFVSPGVGNLYRVGDDGRVTGTSWPLDGTAWVVVAWVGEVLTAVSHQGKERRQRPFPGATVLRVEPSGTCDRCGREVRPWPLERGDQCAPKEWAYCIQRA